ncbi:MAG: aldo/keto reductase [Proteobacteria bacterium]|nr:aldo/keto reductase [Pseudomonadota bacterium]
MEKVTLGRTGLQVTKMALGGIPLSTVMGGNTEEEIEKVIHAALDAGINFIDTSRVYLDSETNIGRALEQRKSKCFIATKTMSRGYEEILADLEESLRELKVDSMEIFQAHYMSKDDIPLFLKKGGGLDAFTKAKERGLTRFIGVTSHYLDCLIELVKTGEFDTVMFPYNVVERDAEKELMQLARKMNVGTLVMKPLSGGALRQIEGSLRFLLDKPVDVILTGMSSVDELEENLAIIERNIPLSPQELKLLEEEVAPLGKLFCRRCGYCLPCTNDIRIPEMIQLMYQTMQGLSYEELPERKKRMGPGLLMWYEACTECGECEKKCPYQLPTIERKRALVELFSRG